MQLFIPIIHRNFLVLHSDKINKKTVKEFNNEHKLLLMGDICDMKIESCDNDIRKFNEIYSYNKQDYDARYVGDTSKIWKNMKSLEEM